MLVFEFHTIINIRNALSLVTREREKGAYFEFRNMRNGGEINCSTFKKYLFDTL